MQLLEQSNMKLLYQYKVLVLINEQTVFNKRQYIQLMYSSILYTNNTSNSAWYSI